MPPVSIVNVWQHGKDRQRDGGPEGSPREVGAEDAGPCGLPKDEEHRKQDRGAARSVGRGRASRHATTDSHGLRVFALSAVPLTPGSSAAGRGFRP